MSIAGSQRTGITLAELLVGIVLLAALSAIATATVTRQNRATMAATEIAEMRDRLRDGAAILAADLRAVSSIGADIYPGGMNNNSLEFRSTIGSSVVCARLASDRIALPPNGEQADGARFTWIYKRLDPGHGVLILDEGASADPDDDSWIARSITGVTSTVDACGASPFTSPADAGLRGYQLTLDVALPASVSTGAPVRMVERVRYALYQSGDSRWYLGYCASNTMASSCAVLQPLSGPYSPPNADQASGLGGFDLYYYDADGGPASDRSSVSRVDIAFRSATSNAVSLAGGTAALVRDTTRVSVELRNR